MRSCATWFLAVLALTGGGAAAAQDAARTGGAGRAPQQAVPAPLPPGSGADVPGGSARNGVIRPPASGDRAIRRPTPRTRGTMPVIPPPGSPGGGGSVVPK